MDQKQSFGENSEEMFLKVSVVSIHDDKVTLDVRIVNEDRETLKEWSTVEHAVPEGKALIAHFGRRFWGN